MSHSGVLVLARACTLNGTTTIARALKAAAERNVEKHVPILYVTLHEQLVKQCEDDQRRLFNYAACVYACADRHCPNDVDVRVLVDYMKHPNKKDLLLRRAHTLYLDVDRQTPLTDAHFEQGELLLSDAIVVDEGVMPTMFAGESMPRLAQHAGVVLGGTFDQLHNGHKILLTASAMLAREQFTCGVTAASMLQNKLLCELIAPIERRIGNVEQFVHSIDSTLSTKVVEITDPFGPSIVDTNLHAIVASVETTRGANAVNERRSLNGLNTLQVYLIDLIDDAQPIQSEESKVSSWKCRRNLLGTLLRPVQRKAAFGANRYVIGLTGGIASGKTHIARYCEEFGATVIDCDKLAHNVYARGTDCFNDIVAHFGQSIVDGQSGEINRRALGGIVFSDKKQLQRLNEIVWPHLWRRVRDIIESDQCRPIVIVDAAVLIEAGWQDTCDEVWACVVPQQEAISRLQSRNNLTRNEAEKRLTAQISNVERVRHAHVVLCSLWEYERTKAQTRHAWELLQQRLPNELRQ